MTGLALILLGLLIVAIFLIIVMYTKNIRLARSADQAWTILSKVESFLKKAMLPSQSVLDIKIPTREDDVDTSNVLVKFPRNKKDKKT